MPMKRLGEVGGRRCFINRPRCKLLKKKNSRGGSEGLTGSGGDGEFGRITKRIPFL